MEMTAKSSILYENSVATVFLIDIPTSIALAQELSPHLRPGPLNAGKISSKQPISKEPTRKRYLLSSSPLKSPYPLSSEPKTEAARANVLARIPHSEEAIHGIIEPIVSGALEDIRSHYQLGSEWCLPRCLWEDNTDGREDECQHPAGVAGTWLGKRRRGNPQTSDAYARNRQFSLANPRIQAQTSEPCSVQPPLILSPGINRFRSMADLCNTIVRNTSPEDATIEIRYSDVIVDAEYGQSSSEPHQQSHTVIVPPLSSFLQCNLPISSPSTDMERPIPTLSKEQKFNLILLDPPWSNRSVRRGGHYQTQSYLDSELLTQKIRDIFAVHSPPQTVTGGITPENQSNLSIAAIWTTNSAKSRKAAYDSLTGAGFSICEEWIWVKTTTDGQPVMALGGLWRKPYEVLVIGRKEEKGKQSAGDVDADTADIFRRVIAAVPDVHSRKPNLRELFERIFFAGGHRPPCGGMRYSALEVFARNLTAGWWACGNEVLKFNSEDWWVDA